MCIRQFRSVRVLESVLNFLFLCLELKVGKVDFTV